ncbi:unnamed protein product [Nippostrongylus brasiliensis]|uniref:Uncharacterized protein n=1 Tax=Nippostrongylus brasiliensis TaxID=27835 RepID=A0A158QZ86_NIPBR|nr:unnamed protein product [Nippostrongylus brasiliensis]
MVEYTEEMLLGSPVENSEGAAANDVEQCTSQRIGIAMRKDIERIPSKEEEEEEEKEEEEEEEEEKDFSTTDNTISRHVTHIRT